MDDNDMLARDHHAMAYNPETKKTILFGGYTQTYLGDTWSWEGKEWKQVSASGPSPRAGKPGFVYYAAGKTLVLFGGWDKTNMPLMDFWKFDDRKNNWPAFSFD